MTDGAKALETALGHTFAKPELLSQALTHSSRSATNYERLEFLGDRVLNLVVADLLYSAFPDESEGSLAKRHAALVQGPMLVKVADEIALRGHILLSDGERQAGGFPNENITADVMEALLGALYLDGGLSPAASFITRLWAPHLRTATQMHADPKTELQEWAQARGYPLPEYSILDRSGPDHAPVFVIEVKVRGRDPVQAEGPSRRAAEKLAAGKMLAALKEQP